MDDIPDGFASLAAELLMELCIDKARWDRQAAMGAGNWSRPRRRYKGMSICGQFKGHASRSKASLTGPGIRLYQPGRRRADFDMRAANFAGQSGACDNGISSHGDDGEARGEGQFSAQAAAVSLHTPTERGQHGQRPVEKTAMVRPPASGLPVPAAVRTKAHSHPHGSRVVRNPITRAQLIGEAWVKRCPATSKGSNFLKPRWMGLFQPDQRKCGCRTPNATIMAPAARRRCVGFRPSARRDPSSSPTHLRQYPVRRRYQRPAW